ncbi:MAG TPA: response regulator transcription factor [Acidimicrobiales bacterium]|nr:response regulator transcription factor [Acidimicrobiales bacterium]
MHILVVEDDARIVSFIEKGLAAEGYATSVARDGESASGLLARADASFDLVLLDLGLPGVSGEEVLRSVRSRASRLPVIVLTARAETEDKVRVLNLGANDYVTKPFSFEELLARIRSAVRVSTQQVATELTVGDLVLDLLTKVARRGDRQIELAPREWALLELFMRHPTHVMTRTRIMNDVFGYDFDTGTNVVDVYVGYLRRKINAPGEETYIKTVRGAGYRFTTP